MKRRKIPYNKTPQISSENYGHLSNHCSYESDGTYKRNYFHFRCSVLWHLSVNFGDSGSFTSLWDCSLFNELSWFSRIEYALDRILIQFLRYGIYAFVPLIPIMDLISVKGIVMFRDCILFNLLMRWLSMFLGSNSLNVALFVTEWPHCNPNLRDPYLIPGLRQP